MTSRRGRPPNATSKRQVTIYIDEDVANSIELLFLDPLTHRIRYGARNALITQLLRSWLRRKQNGTPANLADLLEGEPE